MELKLEEKINLSRICAHLRERGNSGSSTSVREPILGQGISQTSYDTALNAGLTHNILGRERGGYGGSITLRNIDYRLEERDYYSEMALAIQAAWVEAFNYEPDKVYAAPTPAIKTEGRWTRPDVTLICMKHFIHTHTKIWDLVTFEIKRETDIDVLAVFEALAHRSAGTKSYVIFPTSQRSFSAAPAASRIKEECNQHGIGLVLADQPWNPLRYEEIIPPQRVMTNLEKLDDFIAIVGPEFDNRLRRWLG